MNSTLKVISTSPEIIEYFRTPDQYKKYIIDRVYGRMSHSIKGLSFPISLTLKTGTSKFPIKINSPPDKALTIEKKIYLDDQDLPINKYQGKLIANLDKNYFFETYTYLKSIDVINSTKSNASLIIDIKSFESKPLIVYLVIFLGMLFLIFSAISCVYLTRNYIFKPIQLLSNDLTHEFSDSSKFSNTNEVIKLKHIIQVYTKLLKISEKEKASHLKENALAKQALELAHDIRSPLTALSFAVSSLGALPSNKKSVVNDAVERINAIAENLLISYSNQKSLNSKANILNCLFEIVTEKENFVNSQYIKFIRRFNNNIEHEIYCSISSSKLKRVFSNIIDNALESFENNPGIINIDFKIVEKYMYIYITDNGKGIPTHILESIGEMGLSYGKTNNSSISTGLGLYFVKKELGLIGGAFQIDSVVRRGTVVTLKLPKIVDSLNIEPDNLETFKKTSDSNF